MKTLLIALSGLAGLASSGCGSDVKAASSSSSSSAASSASSTSTSSSGSSACDAKAVDGIAVAPSDPNGGQPYALGYPPYSIDDCRLAYVDPSGALHVRDLSTMADEVVAPATAKPSRPALAGTLLAYESTGTGKQVLQIREGSAAPVDVLPMGYDHTGEPRATEGAVVFTAWRGPKDDDDSDVLLYETGGQVSPVSTKPAQQRFADVSPTIVAFTDFTEDPTGAFHEADAIADIVIFDRATKTLTVRKKTGKQAFPSIGDDGRIAYLDWGLVHPEPKFSEYDLVIGGLSADVTADAKVTHVVTSAPYVRPTAHGVLVDWVQWDLGSNPVLNRRKTDLSDAVTPVLMSMSPLYGPAASQNMTVVAVQGAGVMTLRGVAR